MIAAWVVSLQAQEEASLTGGSGRAVHGLWFRGWKQAAPAWADRLHHPDTVLPFSLSPLMGLPRPRGGQIAIVPGQTAWFRIATLTEALTTATETHWLPALPATVELAGTRWTVTGYTDNAAEHPWAGRTRYGTLASQHLFRNRKAKAWQMDFHTPTTFHGSAGHLPFPLPDSLVRSWLRRWNAFASIALPADLPEQARGGMVVSAYRLKTVPVRYGERLMVGAVGWLKLYAVNMHPAMRAAINVLAQYAFYCGSGAKTAQGMGLTRPSEDFRF